MNLSGNVGIDAADDVGRQRAAEAGEPAADREGDGKQPVDVDAEAGGDARIVDRGAQPRAEARADQEYLQRRRDGAADRDDEQPIDADADAEEIECGLAASAGKMNLLRLSPSR